MSTPKPIPPGPGQESVWDYPRPPRLEDCAAHILVVFNGVTIADTHRAKRVLETSHPPNYYIPPDDVRMAYLQKATGSSLCEWKGAAVYFSVVVESVRAERAVWSYPAPTKPFAAIRDYLAFYAGAMDACYVDGERVTPQPGGFYGGWITKNIVGPFKGEPGTMGW
ncbi:MAG: DUF427 domain-containing protein [Candidatus Latescibacterota bacterium]|nr:MAG: DUF427 domain-containing protein [Candidatus Latescibacterota bacterium]